MAPLVQIWNLRLRYVQVVTRIAKQQPKGESLWQLERTCVSGEVQRFVQGAYLESPGEQGEFTVDRVGQRKVLLQSLKDRPEYFSVNLLSAASLANSESLQVTVGPSRSFFRRSPKDPVLRFQFRARVLRKEELTGLLEAMFQTEDRFMNRLSVALNRLHLVDNLVVKVENFSPQCGHSFRLEKGKEPTLHEIPIRRDIPSGSIVFSLWNCSVNYGRRDLAIAARFCAVPAFWGPEQLGARHQEGLAQSALWMKAWTQPDFPLPLTVPIEQHSDATLTYSVSAFLCQSLGYGTHLLAFKDGVPLPHILLGQGELGESYTPGLLLLLNSNRYQVDGSERRLVKNDQLQELLKEVIGQVRKSLSRDQKTAEGRFRSYIHEHVKHFGGLDAAADVSDSCRLDQDFYRFRAGYSPSYFCDIAESGRHLISWCERQYMIIDLTGQESPHFQTFAAPMIKSVALHPFRNWVALALTHAVIVRDIESGTTEFQRFEFGLREASFSTDGERLLVLRETDGGHTELCTRSTQDWTSVSQARFEPGQVHLLGKYVLFLPDGSARPEIRSLLKLDQSIPVARELADYDTIADISPDKSRIILSHIGESKDYLIELASGQVTELKGSGRLFSWNSDIVVCLEAKSLVARDLPYLRQLSKTKVKGDFSISRGGEIQFGDDSRGVYPNGRFLWNKVVASYDPKQAPSKERTVLAHEKQKSPEGVMELRLKVSETSLMEGRSQRLRSQDVQGNWRDLAAFQVPIFCLSPQHFIWQSATGVHTLSRQTGEWRFLKKASLVGQVLLKVGSKWSQLLNPSTGALGAEIRVNPAVPRFVRFETSSFYCRYRSLRLTNSARAMIDSETGQLLATENGITLDFNGQWMVKQVYPLLSIGPKSYGKKLGSKGVWKNLGLSRNGRLHPTKGLFVYPTLAGPPACRALPYDLTETSKYLGEPPDCEIFMSPTGTFNAVNNMGEVSVYHTEEGKRLVTLSFSWLNSEDDDEMQWFGDDDDWDAIGQLTSVSWLNDHTLVHAGILWRTDPQDPWSRCEGLPSPLTERFTSDGQSDLCLSERGGQLDFINIGTGEMLGTLHTLEDDWFVFAPDGRWDSNLAVVDGVEPRPSPQQRTDGLLAQIVRSV
jgi:hypothetical protein